MSVNTPSDSRLTISPSGTSMPMGRADLIVANTTSSTVSVIRVDSAGDVESDHDYPSLNWLNLIAAVDVMATDTKTFLTASENASSLALQLGASDASLSPCQTITSFQIPQGLSARDVDGDGHADSRALGANLSTEWPSYMAMRWHLCRGGPLPH
jgi:hypothetical protein